MKAGSCFVQPPLIRHREISHSKDLEVIEVTAPQRFKTYARKSASYSRRASERCLLQ